MVTSYSGKRGISLPSQRQSSTIKQIASIVYDPLSFSKSKMVSHPLKYEEDDHLLPRCSETWSKKSYQSRTRKHDGQETRWPPPLQERTGRPPLFQRHSSTIKQIESNVLSIVVFWTENGFPPSQTVAGRPPPFMIVWSTINWRSSIVFYHIWLSRDEIASSSSSSSFPSRKSGMSTPLPTA